MNHVRPSGGARGSGKAAQKVRRGVRLSAALRENLKRRKAQARGRAATQVAEADSVSAATPHDSAGIAADKRADGAPNPAPHAGRR
jgi:hypothetical protein